MIHKIWKMIVPMLAMMIFASATVFANPVQVDYYWGDGCGFCAKLKPWLDKYEEEHKDTVQINRFEIWKDKDNDEKFNAAMTVYQVPEGQRGTPTAVVNNHVLVGYQNIINGLDKQVQEAQTNPSKEIVPYKAPAQKKAQPQQPQKAEKSEQKFSQADMDNYAWNKVTNGAIPITMGFVGGVLASCVVVLGVKLASNRKKKNDGIKQEDKK